MKKHLQYIDEKSDKFWEIETSDDSFTVTYGRNGTNGQSQTKTFIDAETCTLEAKKLIAKKIRKGYSQDGIVALATPNSQASKQSNLNAVLEEYTDLVKTGNFAGLLSFLENKSRGNEPELKKQIRKAKSYWLNYVDLSEDNIFKKVLNGGSSWGRRATLEQQDVIVLSAIGLFNLKEIISWDEPVAYFDRVEEKHVLEILKWAKPSWISSFILDKTRKTEWLSVSYRSIRRLEDRGLIEYDPELFIRAVTRFDPWKNSGKCKHTDYIAYITNDVTAYSRDVPGIFSYETALHNQYFANSPEESNKSVLVWERILNHLLFEKKIDRLWFIENCILVQTKDWNANLRSFFRKRLADAKPTTEDLLKYQNSLFHCLHSPLNAVVSFAIDYLKTLILQDGFDLQEFLTWVEPVMMRVDCKGAIKTSLGIFDKIIKAKPEFKTTISYLVSDIFVIADLTLQERSFKTLEKLLEADDIILREKMEMYLPLMQGNIAVLISAFLEKDSTEIAKSEQDYQLVSRKYNFLIDQKRVLPFESFNDILFQFGKFISSFEVIEGEKLINAFITQQDLFPNDALEQLRVYSNQLQKTYFLGSDKNYISGMLVHIIEQREGIYNPSPVTYRQSKIINLPKEILLEVQKKIKAKFSVPLLSFPTHAPHWVDPVVLVQRLLEYKKNGWVIDALDFTIALSRMPRENTQAALLLCDRLESNQADLIKFALGASSEIKLQYDSFLKKMFSGAKSENVLNHATWAVVARTFYADDNFTEFENTSLKNLPNVSHPLIPVAKIINRQNEYKNYSTQQPEYYHFRELSVDLPQSKWDIPLNLLYSLDVYERKADQYVYNFLSHGDVLYWHSLMPQNDQALATMILKYACKNNEAGSDDLSAFLYLSAQDGFVFSQTSLLVIGCSMFCKAVKTRSYASEILIYLITERKIDVKALGEKTAYLISENYGPVQRFIECLTMLRDISSLHNSALIILLDSLISNFTAKDKLPVNFKKLLELYLDLLIRTGSKPREGAMNIISLWKDYNSVKSVLRQIQSI
ncbi:DUF6493 family protein [Dyadobacter psychrotolerans]|uniref:WGR domain-containing protein n=1 Tax=Dyadobacter psychrotolerans TaxID=2541721 RepID=A0A4R5DD47_9BACT|nr:DUF6493 family protein [Dyadobacter psychrotolerans]TDE09574.1 WGR domain-containing protein [Dyadobacter psychrotolerans]